LSSDKPFNESWSIPKGKVEVGETMINAAIRETYEETNINLSKADSFIMLDMVTYT
jgi:ADP-ribose pyrophosphatase YjhB (NUDIX family)